MQFGKLSGVQASGAGTGIKDTAEIRHVTTNTIAGRMDERCMMRAEVRECPNGWVGLTKVDSSRRWKVSEIEECENETEVS